MALTDYTYKRHGITLAYLQGVVPGSGGSVGDQTPPAYQLVTWDSLYKDDLDAAMSTAGWGYLWQGTPPPAKTIANVVPSALAADANPIAVASGWVDVLSGAIQTRGDSSVGVQVTALCAGSVGTPQARVRVNGGAFSNQVIGASAYDFEGGSSIQPIAFHFPRPIADTSPTLTTYTFTLQVQAQGILGTATPKAGTTMTLVEYR